MNQVVAYSGRVATRSGTGCGAVTAATAGGDGDGHCSVAGYIDDMTLLKECAKYNIPLKLSNNTRSTAIKSLMARKSEYHNIIPLEKLTGEATNSAIEPTNDNSANNVHKQNNNENNNNSNNTTNTQSNDKNEQSLACQLNAIQNQLDKIQNCTTFVTFANIKACAGIYTNVDFKSFFQMLLLGLVLSCAIFIIFEYTFKLIGSNFDPKPK